MQEGLPYDARLCRLGLSDLNFVVVEQNGYLEAMTLS